VPGRFLDTTPVLYCSVDASCTPGDVFVSLTSKSKARVLGQQYSLRCVGYVQGCLRRGCQQILGCLSTCHDLSSTLISSTTKTESLESIHQCQQRNQPTYSKMPSEKEAGLQQPHECFGDRMQPLNHGPISESQRARASTPRCLYPASQPANLSLSTSLTQR
jgi:hypothetical protein